MNTLEVKPGKMAEIRWLVIVEQRARKGVRMRVFQKRPLSLEFL